MHSPVVSGILVAGGSSARFGNEDKLMLRLNGDPVLVCSARALDRCPLVSEIVVVARADRMTLYQEELDKAGLKKTWKVVPGGSSRFLSVQNGVKSCCPDTEFYCIHDAARPFVSDNLVRRVIEAAFLYGAAAPFLPLVDTVKEMDAEGFSVRTPDRSMLRKVATPQVFEAARYRAAAENREEAYDDCQLIEQAGGRVFAVEGEEGNIKITTKADLERIRGKSMALRIGHGYDVHRLVENRKLILCGCTIPFEKGLLGHSDADVALHALMDAMLGAAALGDIGLLYPDNAAEFEGANSMLLLRDVVRRVWLEGYAVENCDITVLCQRPKLRPYIEIMREKVAAALKTDLSAVSIKATTEEGLGFTGNGEGIAAHAVVLLRESLLGL